ncbi:MAG: ATP-binding protein [Pseudomonadota bacterium]
MVVTGENVPLIVAAGASALSIASLLWAMRVSDGARGAAKRFKDRSGELESEVADFRGVLGAHPGVVFVWEDEALDVDSAEIPAPEVLGSPNAFAGFLSFTDDSVSANPTVRLVEGLADLEARDAMKRDTTLRQCLRDLRQNGTPFSITIVGQANRFIEADGRTAGARAIVWLTDATIRHEVGSNNYGRVVEARQIIARDPMAFLDMLEKAPFPAWRINGLGKLQWANDAYIRAVDAPNLDKLLDRQTPISVDLHDQAKKTIAAAEDIDQTHDNVAVHGEARSMRVLTFPLSGGAGAMAFDVTAEEAAKSELKRHVDSHDETLNHVADGVAIFSRDRKLTFHNRAFAQMWDLDLPFLLDQPTHGQLLDRLRERRKLPARPDYAAWRADELSYYLDISGVKEDTWSLPDGRTLTVTRQRHPMGGLLLLFKDISSELDLQTQFNALISTQSATLNNLHEACIVFGSDGRLKLSNAAFERLWNLDGEMLKKEPDYADIVDACIPLFHDRDTWNAIASCITDPSPASRQPTTGEMRRSDGSTLTYLTHPLPDGNTLIAFADVTATRRVESALRERAEAFEAADRLKTEFVQNVSYQLRSPLTTILGYAEFLQSQRHGDLSERQLDHVNSILSASDHLSKLIENILDLAMIEAGRMDLDLSDVRLEDLVRESVDMVVTKASDTQVTVRTDIEGDLGLVRADERRIRQVLFNLISNALRFTDAGGEVVVTAARSGDMAMFSVRDNGRGMDEEDQAASFDSFTSGDNRGAGLGLALVKHFIDLHGGNVGMKTADGGGTEVTCWLPVRAEAGQKLTSPIIEPAIA